LLAASTFLSIDAVSASPAKTLDIYFIDVEGGQSTLLVTPGRRSLLIDTGWPGSGLPDARSADPAKSRDANRIVAAARDAGISHIDYLLITHFHPDHDGGVVELAQLMPIRHFIDHGTLPAEARKSDANRVAYEAYLAIRNKSPHLEPLPGDRLPLKEIEAIVVSSAGATLSGPLPGAGQANVACEPVAVPPADAIENPRSTGVLIEFGKFRFLDVGDLSGVPLFNLVCPKSLIGPVDAYLVAHHGGADNANAEIFAAFAPRVVIMNNGFKKGGARETYETLHIVPSLNDVWQLHRSEAAGEKNFADQRIANIDESTAHWIKLSASKSGSFRVLNGRTGEWRDYPARARSN
jgi:competence protein ComEC